MKVGFIGVGKLGKDAAEVMANYHDVIGYDVIKVEPLNFTMVDSIQMVCEDRDMMVDIQLLIYLIKILIIR